jgi:hypothetical protein
MFAGETGEKNEKWGEGQRTEGMKSEVRGQRAKNRIG